MNVELNVICEKNYIKIEKRKLTFRRWRRKNYAVFSTIKIIILISVLSVAYFQSKPAGYISEKQDTSSVKSEYIEEIEVHGLRSPDIYSRESRLVEVITRQKIGSLPAENINSLLKYISGVDVRQRGAEGIQTDISLRGGTFDQVMVLLNGINITDSQTGHHNFNLPVSLQQVERIEVLKGPASRIYGPNAFSGAINIVTKSLFNIF